MVQTDEQTAEVEHIDESGVDHTMNILVSLISALMLCTGMNFVAQARDGRTPKAIILAGISSKSGANNQSGPTITTTKITTTTTTVDALLPALTPNDPEWRSAVFALRGKHLRIPLDGFDPELMKGSFYQGRGTGMHRATDMFSPRNTAIHAVSDGLIAKLFTSRLGGTTIYQFDPTHKYVYYYAHLQCYADGLANGQTVKRGDIIGYVGTSGNAPPNTPHLHFSIGILGKDHRWWQSTPIDPYEIFVVHRFNQH